MCIRDRARNGDVLQKIKKIAIYGDSILKGVIYDEKTRHYSVANEAFEKLAEELPDVQILSLIHI